MASPYKRRRPSLLRNFWIYRRLVGLAVVLGIILWFIWANNKPVTVEFPFALGQLDSSLGLVILCSAAVGGATGALAVTVVLALKRVGSGPGKGPSEEELPLIDDRPPDDYAAKASDAPPGQPWA